MRLAAQSEVMQIGGSGVGDVLFFLRFALLPEDATRSARSFHSFGSTCLSDALLILNRYLMIVIISSSLFLRLLLLLCMFDIHTGHGIYLCGAFTRVNGSVPLNGGSSQCVRPGATWRQALRFTSKTLLATRNLTKSTYTHTP